MGGRDRLNVRLVVSVVSRLMLWAELLAADVANECVIHAGKLSRTIVKNVDIHL